MFADSLAWTFYTSYLRNAAQFGHLKCTEPINRHAVKETHLHKALYFFFFFFFLTFTATQRSGWKKRHDALFLRWLSGCSRVWLNTCCVAQWLLNETHRYPSCREEWHIFKLWTTNRGRGQWTVEIFVLQSLAALKAPLTPHRRHSPGQNDWMPFKVCFWLKMFHFTLPLADLREIEQCDYLCLCSVCYLLAVRTAPSHLNLSCRDGIRDRGQVVGLGGESCLELHLLS